MEIYCQKPPEITYSSYSYGFGTGYVSNFETHFCDAKTAMSLASASSSPSDASMCELFCSRAGCLGVFMEGNPCPRSERGKGCDRYRYGLGDRGSVHV